MVTGRSNTRRAILLAAIIAWLLAFGHAPVMAIHLLSEHMCSEEAHPVSDEHDGHDDDHGHPMPQTLLCRRHSPTFSIGASLTFPCLPAAQSLFTAESYRVVARDFIPLPLRLHLERSPILRN